MSYFVYILRSEVTGQLYIGQTQDLNERLIRHAEGRSAYTRSRGPWTLVYTETYPTRSEAVRREKVLKNKQSRNHLLNMISATDRPVG